MLQGKAGAVEAEAAGKLEAEVGKWPVLVQPSRVPAVTAVAAKMAAEVEAER